MSCGTCDKIIEASTHTTGCECGGPGFCPRLGCMLNDHGYKLCKSNIGYFRHWKESGGAPCVDPPSSTIGLGDMVARIIIILTFGKVKPWPGCGCNAKKVWLNQVQLWPIRWPFKCGDWLNREVADFLPWGTP